MRAESTDGGGTWTPGRDSTFPNPNAAVDFLKLKSGNLLLVYNDTMTGRTPLVAALSTDGDKSYPHRRAIAEGAGDFAYPIAVQTADGPIHVVYTSDGRRVINHAVFSEDVAVDAHRTLTLFAVTLTPAFANGKAGRISRIRGF